MLQHFHILTLTHRNAKLKEIGELVAAFEGGTGLQDHLTRLRDAGIVKEVFYASTCNRILLLFTTDRRVDDSFRQSLLPHSEPGLAKLRHFNGLNALRHLYEVAGSIDSLVVGERQILGQLRESQEMCRKWGLIGDDLRIITNRAVLAAKDIYANTRIGEKSVSIVSLSMQELQRHAPSRRARILLVGAGQTNVLVAKFLRKQGYTHVTVANRTLARAQQLAAGFADGTGLQLDQLDSYTGGFDVLFVCTAAAEATISPERFRQLLGSEEATQKIVVDLGVPADVDEATVRMFPFTYIAIEHLRSLAAENMEFRHREVDLAHEIVDRHLKETEMVYQTRLIERAMSEVPSRIKEIRHTAVTKIFRKELEDLDPETRELMDRMMLYMEKRCIGIPMQAAREAVVR
ncbi:glutamyl-tRNA reductase [Neolewinella xylanilytica]|uniref:Glutamyl-tRNA reductase n=1 Tax=Neolewinella xylanilytica TaxID=1514080 RepID=A0A2S6I304_9BACT|nr:glutamyl-tRNA reductase [Neolewinella xylanilytica]PPK85564.1 glutamyl-tRNA reductase [Neolewinella xylanilytica]